MRYAKSRVYYTVRHGYRKPAQVVISRRWGGPLAKTPVAGQSRTRLNQLPTRTRTTASQPGRAGAYQIKTGKRAGIMMVPQRKPPLEPTPTRAVVQKDTALFRRFVRPVFSITTNATIIVTTSKDTGICWYFLMIDVLCVLGGCSCVVVEYRTHNGEVAGLTHIRSTAIDLEQVANLLCAQANSASYPQLDGK